MFSSCKKSHLEIQDYSVAILSSCWKLPQVDIIASPLSSSSINKKQVIFRFWLVKQWLYRVKTIDLDPITTHKDVVFLDTLGQHFSSVFTRERFALRIVVY